jgi:hypothetical protein
MKVNELIEQLKAYDGDSITLFDRGIIDKQVFAECSIGNIKP